MSDNKELKHDFDASWLSPLDIEQIHYLFFYMITENKYFVPKPSNAQQIGANPNAVHNWDDLAFYLNTKCPDSTKHTINILRTAWQNFFKAPHQRSLIHNGV